jgi:hypothetical protein
MKPQTTINKFLREATGLLRLHFIHGLPDCLEKNEIFLSTHLHTPVIIDFQEIEPFCLSNPGKRGLDLPGRIKRQYGVLFKRKDPIIQLNSAGADINRTKTKKKAVKKPEDNEYPDGKDDGMFGLFFYKRTS